MRIAMNSASVPLRSLELRTERNEFIARVEIEDDETVNPRDLLMVIDDLTVPRFVQSDEFEVMRRDIKARVKRLLDDNRIPQPRMEI
jgi:hypothetical protein